ncbi:MAG: DMT family transporter [Rickettsiales bacterium]|nr:DMT family transporter [Rickettsiales bacterium]
MNATHYTLIMILAGIGIPIMATLNSRLGVGLSSPVLAAAAVATSALGLCLFILLFFKGFKATPTDLPFYYYVGGVLFGIYVISITYVAPHFGIANSIFCVLLGQAACSIVIDHYGLFGTPVYTFSSSRLIGMLLMIAGLFFVRRGTV